MKPSFNKIKNVLFVAVLMLSMACAETDKSSQVQVDPNVDVTFVEEVGATEKYVANIAIDGMACEMSCGSKIAKELNALDGVKKADIDFVGLGEENFAMVEFDANTVSEQEMIKTVQSIANGSYTVNAVEVKHIVAEEASGDDGKVSVYKPEMQYKLPNIFSVFTRLF